MHGLLGHDRLHMEKSMTFESTHLMTANAFRLRLHANWPIALLASQDVCFYPMKIPTPRFERCGVYLLHVGVQSHRVVETWLNQIFWAPEKNSCFFFSSFIFSTGFRCICLLACKEIQITSLDGVVTASFAVNLYKWYQMIQGLGLATVKSRSFEAGETLSLFPSIGAPARTLRKKASNLRPSQAAWTCRRFPEFYGQGCLHTSW